MKSSTIFSTIFTKHHESCSICSCPSPNYVKNATNCSWKKSSYTVSKIAGTRYDSNGNGVDSDSCSICIFFYKFVYVVDGLFFDYVFYSFLLIVAIDTTLFIFFLYLVAFTRKIVRSEYDIPQLRCKGCEDCALSIFCATCTIAQMGWHTAEYETYIGHCCTDNGLLYHIEVKLPSDPTYCIPNSPLSTMKIKSIF